MKLHVMFLLLALAFFAAESQASSKVFCVKKDEVLNDLKGQQGLPGPPGLKGEKGNWGEGGSPGIRGEVGPSGLPGPSGGRGEKGERGQAGVEGMPGINGVIGQKGQKGDRGIRHETGSDGEDGEPGDSPDIHGDPGEPGLPGAEIKEDLLLSLLNDYYVNEDGYYNELYHVTARELTDGRADTGGWGSSSSNSGCAIQATYVRPVYVTSVTVAGGLIPSWGTDTKDEYGQMELFYSNDENENRRAWHQAVRMPTPVGEQLVTYNLTSPVTAKYWRITSKENKWVGLTEFALKPLVNPE